MLQTWDVSDMEYLSHDPVSRNLDDLVHLVRHNPINWHSHLLIEQPKVWYNRSVSLQGAEDP